MHTLFTFTPSLCRLPSRCILCLKWRGRRFVPHFFTHAPPCAGFRRDPLLAVAGRAASFSFYEVQRLRSVPEPDQLDPSPDEPDASHNPGALLVQDRTFLAPDSSSHQHRGGGGGVAAKSHTFRRASTTVEDRCTAPAVTGLRARQRSWGATPLLPAAEPTMQTASGEAEASWEYESASNI